MLRRKTTLPGRFFYLSGQGNGRAKKLFWPKRQEFKYLRVQKISSKRREAPLFELIIFV